MEISEKYYSLSPNEEIGDGECDWKTLSNNSRHTADCYTEGRWMDQVRTLLPKDTKKILLASDYITQL